MTAGSGIRDRRETPPSGCPQSLEPEAHRRVPRTRHAPPPVPGHLDGWSPVQFSTLIPGLSARRSARPSAPSSPDESPTTDHRSGRARILPITAAAAALVLAGGTAAFAHAQKTVTLDVNGEVDAAEHVRRLGRRPPGGPGRRRRRAGRREPARLAARGHGDRRAARAPGVGQRRRRGDVRLDDRAVRRRGARLARRPRPVRGARRVAVRRRWPAGARARPHAARSGGRRRGRHHARGRRRRRVRRAGPRRARGHARARSTACPWCRAPPAASRSSSTASSCRTSRRRTRSRSRRPRSRTPPATPTRSAR